MHCRFQSYALPTVLRYVWQLECCNHSRNARRYDTARSYGKEDLLGAALKLLPGDVRARLSVSTKSSPVMVSSSAAQCGSSRCPRGSS